jgi:hypothetical protein
LRGNRGTGAMAFPISDEDSVDIIFHGAPYNLSVTVLELTPEPTLALDLEEIGSGACYGVGGGGGAEAL